MNMAPLISNVPFVDHLWRFTWECISRPRPSTDVNRQDLSSCLSVSLDETDWPFHRVILFVILAYALLNSSVLLRLCMAGSCDVKSFSYLTFLMIGIVQTISGIWRPPSAALAWKYALGVSTGSLNHRLTAARTELSIHFRILFDTSARIS